LVVVDRLDMYRLWEEVEHQDLHYLEIFHLDMLSLLDGYGRQVRYQMVVGDYQDMYRLQKEADHHVECLAGMVNLNI
jgi:hypothetical protein